MKIRLLLTLSFIAVCCCSFSQVLYSSTAEYGNRFNPGLGKAGTPNIAFDDVSFPNEMAGAGDSISVTKVKVGIRRTPGAPPVDVKIYYTPFDDTSTSINTYIKVPPVLLGTVSLPANPSSLFTTVVAVGDSVSTLFKMKPDTSTLFPGYRTIFIGASLSDSNKANGIRSTSGNKANSNHIWIYNADSSLTRYEGHFDNSDALFYIQVFGHQSSSSLPVTLSNFSGVQKDGANLLMWNTQTELNNKGFELQRSSDGLRFSAIGFVGTKATNGSSSYKLSYQYSDRNYQEGNNFYRLQQVDKDGHSTLSNVVLLKSNGLPHLQFTNVYPNPVKSMLNATIASVVNENVHIIISDFAGRILIRSAEKLSKGSNNFSLNVSGLSAGSYTIKAVSESGDATVYKFIKQ